MAVPIEARGGTAPAPDWREQMLTHYAAEGFIVWEVLPSPTSHPVARNAWETGGGLEFDQTELPYTDPHESEIEQTYRETLDRHKAELGRENVRQAYVTERMAAEHPEYTEHPHRVVMIRSTGVL